MKNLTQNTNQLREEYPFDNPPASLIAELERQSEERERQWLKDLADSFVGGVLSMDSELKEGN